METYSFIPRGYRGRIFIMTSAMLAICLMGFSAIQPPRYDSFACYGLLGIGFPTAFICDYSNGDNPIFTSPENNVEMLDKTDFPYFSLQGVFVDFLYYETLILIAWFGVTYGIHLARRKINRNEV